MSKLRRQRLSRRLFAVLNWVQTLLGLGLCAVVLGMTYLLKEIVVALTKPFLRPPQQAVNACPCDEWKQLQREMLQKMDRLLARSILNLHLGKQ